MNIKISEVENMFKEVFSEEDGKVSTIETVYETPKDDSFIKLILSLQGLSTENASIIHTKFIFKVDKDRKSLVENSFIYLYDINCVYHKIDFDNIIDLQEKIEDIVSSGDFGEDIQILSDFIESPALFLNYYMKRAKITDYSIFDVEYSPKFKTTPCDETTFDFKININNNYFMNLSIWKIEADDKDDVDKYKFQFKFMDEIKTVESDTLNNIHYFIGSNIAKLLDTKLKNKD